MHIANETRAALDAHPQDIHELLLGIPHEFRPTPIRGNEDALDQVRGAESAIDTRWGDGAHVDADFGAPHWHLEWAADWWVLVGHLYPARSDRRGYGVPSQADRTSPLVLLHRATNTVYYGEELLPLAARVIAHSLAYKALREPAQFKTPMTGM